MNAGLRPTVTVAILAGGRGRRMGGQDKGLVEFAGRPLIEAVLDAIRPQADEIVINANRNQERYAAYGHRVIADDMTDYQGPLAGLAVVMQASDSDYVVTVPCDGPLLANDLVQRLLDARQADGADIAVAHDGERMQPVYAMVTRTLLDDLRVYLAGGDRKIDLWYARHRVALADFSDARDTFANINTDGERAALLDAQR